MNKNIRIKELLELLEINKTQKHQTLDELNKKSNEACQRSFEARNLWLKTQFGIEYDKNIFDKGREYLIERILGDDTKCRYITVQTKWLNANEKAIQSGKEKSYKYFQYDKLEYRNGVRESQCKKLENDYLELMGIESGIYNSIRNKTASFERKELEIQLSIIQESVGMSVGAIVTYKNQKFKAIEITNIYNYKNNFCIEAKLSKILKKDKLSKNHISIETIIDINNRTIRVCSRCRNKAQPEILIN